MISTESGSRCLSVKAADEAPRIGGIWFSVMICEGIDGEACAGEKSSWTFRSKICDEAGECRRGEAERNPRLGDDGDI